MVDIWYLERFPISKLLQQFLCLIRKVCESIFAAISLCDGASELLENVVEFRRALQRPVLCHTKALFQGMELPLVCYQLLFAILPRCVPGQAEERREENDRSGHSSISEPHLISAMPLLG